MSETLPPQEQGRQPGHEEPMHPEPQDKAAGYKGSHRLEDKVAIITGGDSGIGRSVAVSFAKEGADVIVAYLSEEQDARETRRLVEEAGRKCLLISGDIGDRGFCDRIVKRTMEQTGRIDILVNNAAEQHVQESLEELPDAQLHRTFATNIFSMFYLTRSALEHMKRGACIINTASITAYRGSPHLVDYAATKGAIVAFTRSMALQLIDRGIRINAVAPGPIWTPLIPASFSAEHVKSFGGDTPMERPGQADEVSPSYVFLALDENSYMTGQVLHPNGGTILNG